MPSRHLPCAIGLALFGAVCAATAAASDKLPPPSKRFDFHKDIRPILESSCVECHGAAKQKGKFRIDSREHLLKGSENGEVLKLRKSADSTLIHVVARLDEDAAMPPKKEEALKPEQVALLRAWIDAGAPWPEGFVIREAGKPSSVLDADDLAKLPPPAARKVDFVADVQPIFRDRCYECHGSHRQEAGFRLDHKPTVLAGGELGRALEPGKSAESLLIHFVAGLRPEGVMPKKGARLSAEQIGVLRAWIDQGANFPETASVVLKDPREHWAFKPPVRPAVPEVGGQKSEVRNPIDAFIAARLEKESLTFSPEAPKATLLRRLQLDLTGLPPTIAELDAFLADEAPDAYERQVERLLASPHYGERWARHWLDAARYADSDGYEKDKPRIAHFYRDWVIQALNRDLPYDQFIVEQLAGDLLPGATQEQIVATGYLRNSMINEEGGVDPEQFRMEAMFDRMEAIGRGILGLTVGCAQCHTHKYDPISHDEYYRLFAFLNNDHEAQPRVFSPEERKMRAEVLRQIGEIEARLQHESPDWREQMAQWEDAWRARPRPEWQIVAPEVDKNATGGQRYLPQDDGSFLLAGFQPTKSTGVLTLKTEVVGITGLRLEMLHDPNLPAQGPGRSFMGTFALSEFQVQQKQADGKNAALKFAKASADLAAAPDTAVDPAFNEKEPKKRVIGPASYAIDGNNDTGWASDLGPGRRNFESTAVFALEKPINEPADLTFRLVQNIGGWNADDLHANQMGRFRISITTSPNPEADSVPPHVRAALEVPREKRTPAQVATIFTHWRTTVPAWKDANAKIEALWKQHPEGTTQMTLAARDEMRLTSVLKRGDWLKPGKPVQPGVPAALNPLPADAGTGRLAFARWITARDAPTTARAAVNRVWQACFGTGIVSTSEDLGTQTDPPSHPELLDWLAVEFMERGWSLKALHRLIVTSRTYRQSSKVTPELLAKDPANRLLARGPRQRVEGEIVRDLQLALSGLLNPKMFGRAVMPAAPAFLFEPPASYAPFPWKEEAGEDRYRRAIYTWRRRTTPYPMLATFDTPEGNVACVRRVKSNTPLQALVGLNETVSMEAARALAARILRGGGTTDADRLGYAFRLCLSRPPTEPERAELVRLMEKQRPRFADGWLNAWELATGQPAAQPSLLPKGTTPAQLASYTLVARVLLNLDETITKQ
jgi:mono/diheme cytochrome c family protein